MLFGAALMQIARTYAGLAFRLDTSNKFVCKCSFLHLLFSHFFLQFMVFYSIYKCRLFSFGSRPSLYSSLTSCQRQCTNFNTGEEIGGIRNFARVKWKRKDVPLVELAALWAIHELLCGHRVRGALEALPDGCRHQELWWCYSSSVVASDDYSRRNVSMEWFCLIRCNISTNCHQVAYFH